MPTVIVFGPTGGVGSYVAKSAAEHGAKVVLAMRNTSKAIPELSAEEEKAKGYVRVKADLNDAASVREAVKSSGATRAYFYIAHGGDFLMQNAINAMKEGGVTFAVFLSTASIPGRAEDVPKDEILPWLHAQVELLGVKAFGADNFVAMRPGAFATNSIGWHANDWSTGVIKLCRPEFVFDNIPPEEMGAVGGTILANGPKKGQHVVWQYGAEVLSQKEMFATISKVIGRDVKTKEISHEEFKADLLKLHIPAGIVDSLVKALSPPGDGHHWLIEHEEGKANTELYTGKPGMTFAQWVEKNKSKFIEALDGKA